MLPSISNEVANKIKQFYSLIEQIDSVSEKGEINETLLHEYSKLRAQMKARMDELGLYYSDNVDDERIHFVEKLRLKIKKALHNRPGKKIADCDLEDMAS